MILQQGLFLLFLTAFYVSGQFDMFWGNHYEEEEEVLVGPSRRVRVNGVELVICEEASCDGRCGNTTMTTYGGCFCDDICLFYGDCCFDFILQCINQSDSEIYNSPTAYEVDYGTYKNLKIPFETECVEYLAASNESLSMWTITKCPDEVNNDLESFVSKCENSSSGNDLEAATALIVNGVLYKNYYCAVCHGVLTTDFRAYQGFKAAALPLAFLCRESTELAFTFTTNSSYEGIVEFFLANCDLTYSDEIFTMGINSHLDCNVIGMNECNRSLADSLNNYDELEQGCNAYKSQVVIINADGHVVYRNPHCALCSGISNHTCYKSAGRIPLNLGYTPMLPTFQILLDFGGEASSSNVMMNGEKLCLAGTKRDVITSECTMKRCKDGHVFVANQCVPYTDSSELFVKVNESYVFTLLIEFKVQDSCQKSTIQQLITDPLKRFYSPISGKMILLESIQTAELELQDALKDVIGKVNALVNGTFLQDSSFLILTQLYFPYTFEIHALYSSLPYYQYLFRDLVTDLADVASTLGAGLESMYLFPFDLIKSELFCTGESKLSLETDIAILVENEVMVGRYSDPAVVNKKTGMRHDRKEVVIGMSFQASRGNNTQGNVVMLKCEASILSCNQSKIANSSFLIKDKELHFQHGKETAILSPTSFILLPSGDAVVCESVYGKSAQKKVDNFIQGLMTLIGNALSVICLFLTLVTYSVFAPLRTVPGKAIMNLCASLAIAQLLFQVGPLCFSHPVLCTIVSALDHYLWLVTFGWMSVLAFNASRSFSSFVASVHSFKTDSVAFLSCVVYAWGTPMVAVIACFSLHYFTDLPVYYRNEIDEICWLGNHITLLCAFAAPIALIICCNIGLFTHSVISIRRTFLSCGEILEKREDLMVYIRLSVLMGFTWLFGFLANIDQVSFLSYLFILLNTLQGVFIFSSYVCTERVRGMWSKVFKNAEILKRTGNSGTQASLSSRITKSDGNSR